MLIIVLSLISIITIWNIRIIKKLPIILELKKIDTLYNSLEEHVVLNENPTNQINTAFFYNNLSFYHPFGNITGEQNNIGYVMKIDEEKTIAVSIRPNSNSELYDLLSDKEKQLITKYYSKDVLKSEFNLRKKAMEMTPKDISFLSFSPSKIDANIALLSIKIDTPKYNKMFYFKTKNVQGFQYELNKVIILQIYDSKDKSDKCYEIYMRGPFTQEDIDIILSTMIIDTE